MGATVKIAKVKINANIIAVITLPHRLLVLTIIMCYVKYGKLTEFF